MRNKDSIFRRAAGCCLNDYGHTDAFWLSSQGVSRLHPPLPSHLCDASAEAQRAISRKSAADAGCRTWGGETWHCWRRDSMSAWSESDSVAVGSCTSIVSMEPCGPTSASKTRTPTATPLSYAVACADAALARRDSAAAPTGVLDTGAAAALAPGTRCCLPEPENPRGRPRRSGGRLRWPTGCVTEARS